MRVQSVRFPDRVWSSIVAQARGQGISASQYIREAVLTRLVWEVADEAGVRLPELSERINEIAREVLAERVED